MGDMAPIPSKFLPQIRRDKFESDALEIALDQLDKCMRKGTKRLSSVDETSMDDFERTYAIQWLTNLLRVICVDGANRPATEDRSNERTESLLSRAADLLMISSGSSALSSALQTFTMTLGEKLSKDGTTLSPSSPPIEISINDGSINSHDLPGAVGMQTWGSAMMLAKRIAEDPNVFIPLCNPPSFPNRFHQRPLRILELGAGTGLVSLAVAKIASLICDRQARSSINGIAVEIFATDYDRAVLSNLRDNIRRNESLNGCVSLKACSLDWEQYYQLRMGRDGNTKEDFRGVTDPEGEKMRAHSFDLVLAADVVYELQHAEWLKATVQSLLRYPGHDATTTSQSVNNPLFHLVAPIRHTHRAELESIVQVFSPYATPAPDSRGCAAQYRLSILRSHHIDDGEENGFIWYEIGWVSEQYFPAATVLNEQIDKFNFPLL
ncbi:uncharacterized protein EI90DRAFT_3036407 [Cantharellus anzutake]|uniref:uncharacterized protein n=1 Tax=Cantharellus anzutake TaxID=1750568 RepID=UPI0019047A28|nr:uncharacterized protein EI90DRAFT_3036407 [Cantharellus anzutake]KAF8340667.1 hypothetical protein EI90DRAFT_3036407 [Cantharellus anzutake]